MYAVMRLSLKFFSLSWTLICLILGSHLFTLTYANNIAGCRSMEWHLSSSASLPLSLNASNFESVVKSNAGNDGYIIMSTFGSVTDQNVQYLQNVFYQLDKVKLIKKAMFFCSFFDDCNFVWNRNVPAYCHEDPSLPERIGPIVYKYKIALFAFEAGVDVLFVDWDIGIKSDFTQHVRLSTLDLQMLTDLDPISLPLDPHRRIVPVCGVIYPQPSFCFSTGIWFAKNSPLMRTFFEAVFRESFVMWEQLALNVLLPHYVYGRNGSRGLNVGILPFPQFTNIHTYEFLKANPRNKDAEWVNKDVHLMHCGYTHKFEKKVSALRDYGLWEPEKMKPFMIRSKVVP